MKENGEIKKMTLGDFLMAKQEELEGLAKPTTNGISIVVFDNQTDELLKSFCCLFKHYKNRVLNFLTNELYDWWDWTVISAYLKTDNNLIIKIIDADTTPIIVRKDEGGII